MHRAGKCAAFLIELHLRMLKLANKYAQGFCPFSIELETVIQMQTRLRPSMLVTELTVRRIIAAASNTPRAPIAVGQMGGVVKLNFGSAWSLRAREQLRLHHGIFIRSSNNLFCINASIAPSVSI